MSCLLPSKQSTSEATSLTTQPRATVLNTPFDVVKSRIQNSPKIKGQVPKYNWAWGGLSVILKEEGFGALYKGFLPKVLRLGPGGGVLLVVYTGVMDWFRTFGAKPII